MTFHAGERQPATQPMHLQQPLCFWWTRTHAVMPIRLPMPLSRCVERNAGVHFTRAGYRNQRIIRLFALSSIYDKLLCFTLGSNAVFANRCWCLLGWIMQLKIGCVIGHRTWGGVTTMYDTRLVDGSECQNDVGTSTCAVVTTEATLHVLYILYKKIPRRM